MRARRSWTRQDAERLARPVLVSFEIVTSQNNKIVHLLATRENGVDSRTGQLIPT